MEKDAKMVKIKIVNCKIFLFKMNKDRMEKGLPHASQK